MYTHPMPIESIYYFQLFGEFHTESILTLCDSAAPGPACFCIWALTVLRLGGANEEIPFSSPSTPFSSFLFRSAVTGHL